MTVTSKGDWFTGENNPSVLCETIYFRYGGDCVGAFKQKSARLAPESIAHGLFLDQSHDNPSPIHTRSAFDILPTAAMLTMASCAVGSNRGYDELVRDHVRL